MDRISTLSVESIWDVDAHMDAELVRQRQNRVFRFYVLYASYGSQIPGALRNKIIRLRAPHCDPRFSGLLRRSFAPPLFSPRVYLRRRSALRGSSSRNFLSSSLFSHLSPHLIFPISSSLPSIDIASWQVFPASRATAGVEEQPIRSQLHDFGEFPSHPSPTLLPRLRRLLPGEFRRLLFQIPLHRTPPVGSNRHVLPQLLAAGLRLPVCHI